jgi:HTH-type transcriptional regulator / antitoxin HigA
MVAYQVFTLIAPMQQKKTECDKKIGKMTPIYSQYTYTDLLIQYQPKLIQTKDEYYKALEILEGMMSGELTEAETTLFELLVLLIETYEERNYPVGDSTSVATLESLMHEFEVEPASLVEIFGSLEVVKKVLNGQWQVNQSQAESLAKFFNDRYPEICLKAIDFQ